MNEVHPGDGKPTEENVLRTTVQKLNRITWTFFFAGNLLRLVRAVILATLMAGIWSIVQPQQIYEQLVLALLVFVMSLSSSFRFKRHKIEDKDLLMSLEIDHPETRHSAFSLKRADAPTAAEWSPHLTNVTKQMWQREWRNFSALLSTLVLPILFMTATFFVGQPSLGTALDTVAKVVASFSRGATLEVIQGAATADPPKKFPLSTSEPLEIELLSQNLVQVQFNTGNANSASPTVELRNAAESPATSLADGEETSVGQAPQQQIFQNFQMTAVSSGKTEGTVYNIAFAVSTDVELYIPLLSANKPLARIKVRQLPIPKVSLIAPPDMEDPWPDDQPLFLTIEVEAENPLDLIQLLISSGNRTSKELVSRIVAEDRTAVTTTYNLVLEPYIESDIAEVEIVAEAIDRSLPAPLAGRSKPLRITTASSYGRYRQTLQTLREMKGLLDTNIEEQKAELSKEATALSDKAVQQAERSPFFDGLDRVQISRFDTRAQEIQGSPDMTALMEFSSELNEFLFEHEILDDRERDRDFFVAARSLSRLIEQPTERRPVGVESVTNRMKEFLNGRRERWKMRVDRLDDKNRPESWQNIETNKPFTRSMERITESTAVEGLDAQNAALGDLSETVVAYRKWIEELEAKEDEFRNQQERERQQGLASARNELRELQKRQGKVSTELDRSGQRQQQEMNSEWPAVRMQQNSNIGDTGRLEGQMRSLSLVAGARIKAAKEAMEKTVEAGNDQNFVLAESAADMAGRLLRQAESAAQNSQRQQRNRGRRRRVTGDNYYGQSVVGGDIEIKREYQVDRRYREDILNEVQSSSYQEDNRVLMDNYLRRIIR